MRDKLAHKIDLPVKGLPIESLDPRYPPHIVHLYFAELKSCHSKKFNLRGSVIVDRTFFDVAVLGSGFQRVEEMFSIVVLNIKPRNPSHLVSLYAEHRLTLTFLPWNDVSRRDNSMCLSGMKIGQDV